MRLGPAWCGRRDLNPHDFHHGNLIPRVYRTATPAKGKPISGGTTMGRGTNKRAWPPTYDTAPMRGSLIPTAGINNWRQRNQG